MEAIKIFEHAVRGLIEGMGVDAGTRILAAYIPQLAAPSPIPVPGYDPAGMHYDDLISHGISVAVIAFGAIKRNFNFIAEGVTMLIGNWITSHMLTTVPITTAVAPTMVPTSAYSDLVKVD